MWAAVVGERLWAGFCIGLCGVSPSYAPDSPVRWGFRSPQHDEEVGEGLYLSAARWPVPSGQTARPASGHGCTGARRPPALLREAGTVPSKGTDPRSDEVKAPEMILVPSQVCPRKRAEGTRQAREGGDVKTERGVPGARRPPAEGPGGHQELEEAGAALPEPSEGS